MTTKGTANHVYFVDEKLGTGSSAMVYTGRNKKSGQLCAVKVYTDVNHTQKREFQTMKMLNHGNIIKFISIEPDSHTKENVLIMELCTGGSVLNMLEKPEFAYGFPEDEFLVFLKDITSGFLYLRENQIVHRDIKPGNILKFIKDDMSSQYKLTDFGAARELGETDEFVSIYGTEEYLDPRVYHEALLSKNSPRKTFNASIDLWSLGVTLYHVSTGQLPFQAYGGRKNKEDMFRITSMKPSGFISGIQRKPDSPIEWSEDLPDTCLLSRTLKRKLKRMLASLLETDLQVRWKFDDFFKYSMDVTSRKVFHILSLNDFCLDRFYADDDSLHSVSHFIDSLKSEMQTHSLRSMQYFHPFLSIEEILKNPSSEALSSPSPPLYLYPHSHKEIEWKPPSLRPILEIPKLLTTKSLATDYLHAYKSSALIYFFIRKSKDIVRLSSLLETFFFAIWNDFMKEVSKIHEIFETIHGLTKLKINYPHKNSRSCDDHPFVYNGVLDYPDILPLGRAEGPTALPKKSSDLSEETLLSEKHQFSEKLIKCKSKLTTLEIKKLRKMYEESLEITKKFHNQANSTETSSTNLTHNEHQIHKFEKNRITKLISLSRNLHEALADSLTAFLDHFKCWFGYHCKKKKQLECEVKQFREHLNFLEIPSSVKRDDISTSPYENLADSHVDQKADILETLDKISKHQQNFRVKNAELLHLAELEGQFETIKL